MTTTIGIYRPGTPATLQATVNIDEKTRMIKKLMGDWHVTADFNVTSVLDIQIGDYITYDGENYYINRLPDITKLNNATFQYKIDFEHSLYNLKKKLFISYDGLADFSYNGTAEDFITNIVAAINEIDSGWTVGTVDSTDPITLQFTNESCHAALVRVAEAFGLEWTVASKAISLEASAGTIRELTFEYGRGSGLYKLTRQQVHDQNITTKVYGFGGDKNISEDYRDRAKRLVFAATGQQPCSASSYPYLTNNIDLYGTIEGQFTDDNIYPQRTSTLTGASISFAAAAPYAFSERSSYVEDSEMDFDINDYLIDGKVATMVFKTGDLAGVECEIWKYDHSNKRFYIRSYADVDGYVMPNYNSGSPIQPEIGDSYTLVNIAMPQTYIDTAEAALQAATQTYINKNSVPQVVYDCLFDWKYAKTQELKLDAGDKVTVTDSDLGVDAQVRIAAIEYPLVNIYKIKATIADFVPYTLQERIIKTTISTKKETVFVERRNTELARRNTMRQNQMQGMLFDSDGYFDPENIKPLSIETTYLSVGTKSRDFWLSNVTIKANYEGDANALYVTAGSLIHLQLEITGVGYEWVISTPLDQDSLTPATAYYLYAKCSTSALTGEWILSASQITTEEVSGYYHFLIGMLFAVSDDRRDFDFTNGMTYINGGTITTGKIQSIGGDSYFDLTQNKFKVGDSNSSLDWNVTAASTLTIKGALVQSGAGTTSVLPCFRGAYASGYTYYKGDSVTYNGETWLYINDEPSTNTPVEGVYWTKYAAKGSGGATVALTPTKQVFNYDASGNLVDSGAWFLWATVFNVTGTIYYEWLRNDVQIENDIHSGLSIVPPNNISGMPVKYQVNIRVGSTSSPILATDVLTIYGVKPGADGVSITLVDVEFAKNTNPTTAPTTGWTTTAPTLAEGEQLWTRTKTTYSSGNPTYSTPANITPKKGDTGAVGQGVESVTEEFAISTSKTTQPTTGWSTTQPTWVQGQYIWSRVKVVYKNPTSTVYTGYAVSSEWEAVNNLEIGGRNLLLNSYFDLSSSSYGINESNRFMSEPYIEGEVYTITLWGNLGADRTDFCIYNHFSTVQICTLQSKGNGVYQRTFTAGANLNGINEFRILQSPSNGTSTSYIEKVQIEKGNKATDWTPAPEDVQAAIAISAVLSNEAHTIPAAHDGTVLSFSGSGTDIVVFKGVTPIAYGIGANTFDVSATPTNVTPDSTPETIDTYTRRYGDITGMSADSGNISFTIKIRDVNSVETTITKVQSFSKSKAGADGEDGIDGSSPALVFRGVYSSSATYYGTPIRVDAVKDSNGAYWRAKTTAPGGSFYGQAPAEGDYWTAFGASFESIATGTLLAEFANIANFIFKNGKLISQKGTINGVESTDYSNANFIPYISLDGNTGDLMAMKATIEGAINAGSIGGFTIANGRIGSLEDEDGLSLLSSLIKFYNVIATTNVPSTSYVWAGIGENVLAPSSGLRALGRFENNEQQGSYQQVFDHYDYYYSVGDYMNAGAPTPAEWVYDENGDLLYIQVTIYRNKWVIISNSKNYGIISSVEGADSNIAFKARKGQISALYGGIVAWDTGYSGAAYSDVLEYYIHRYSNFFFSSISSSLLVVRLPAKSFISAKTYGEVQFFLNIVIGNSANAIQLTSVTNGQIVDNNGNNLSYINMYKGDSVLLRYSNGCYYIVSLRQ